MIEIETIKIELIDIVKLQHWYMDVSQEEDCDFPNYRVVSQKNRHIQRVLNQITDDEEKQREIYDIIVHGSWNTNDNTYKPICDELRNKGYEIINTYNEKKKEKQKQYYQEHKEERTKYQKEWVKNNYKKVLKNNKNYKNRHKDEIRKKKKEHYEQNKERILAQQKEYRKNKRKNRR